AALRRASIGQLHVAAGILGGQADPGAGAPGIAHGSGGDPSRAVDGSSRLFRLRATRGNDREGEERDEERGDVTHAPSHTAAGSTWSRFRPPRRPRET